MLAVRLADSLFDSYFESENQPEPIFLKVITIFKNKLLDVIRRFINRPDNSL